MPTRYCQHCRAVRNMRVTVSRREERTPEGEKKVIETRSLHCETCTTFVSSEDTEVSSCKD